jgi:hypothetical protein
LLLGAAIGVLWSLLFLPPSPLYQPRQVEDLSDAQRARDDAARARARQFVEDLGFTPAGVVCWSQRSGSGWCTVRVEGTDKTFALFCSWRHPSCVENTVQIDP